MLVFSGNVIKKGKNLEAGSFKIMDVTKYTSKLLSKYIDMTDKKITIDMTDKKITIDMTDKKITIDITDKKIT